ncbi:MAG: 30S ribosomal protein S4 [Thermodesulfobacteriota bacterium]|nr:30S ribosomal protein S4 [Thermodesulfobacteriota bacterium]
MGRDREAVCRLCRREGSKLFLKGDRCYSDKCAFEKRPFPPGQQLRRTRSKFSNYGIQLREKQKVKRMYGLMEKQFRNYFLYADKKKGVTGTNLLILFERRLDNVVYRLGFASSRREARQLVSHKHFLVDEKKVNIPSFLVKKGNTIALKEKSKNIPSVLNALEAVERRQIPNWLELDRENFRGRVLNFPVRDDITMPIQEQLIVELYSR